MFGSLHYCQYYESYIMMSLHLAVYCIDSVHFVVVICFPRCAWWCDVWWSKIQSNRLSVIYVVTVAVPWWLGYLRNFSRRACHHPGLWMSSTFLKPSHESEFSQQRRRHTFHTVYLSLPDTPKTEVAWIPMNPESTYSTATCVILDHSVWWTTLLCSSLLSTSPPLLWQMMMLYRVVKMIRPWSIVVLSIYDAAVPPNESTMTPLLPPPYQWRSKRHCRLYHNMS